MSSSFFDSELHELMLRHVEGETSAAEARRLEFVLRSSPKAQREYAELLLQVVQLRSIGQERNITVLEPSERRIERKLRGRPAIRAWGGIAATLVAVGLLAWLVVARLAGEAGTIAFENIPDATSSSNGVAVITRGAGVEWNPEVNANLGVGVAISPGRLRLKKGVIQLRMAGGAEVILEAPAEFRIISPQETALRFGRLNAHVPPEARGFVVHSAGTKVTDLGTEFGMHKPAFTPLLQLHVFDGRVQYSSAGERKAPDELTGGEAVEIRKKGIRQIRADRMAFVSLEQLKQREFTEVHDRYQAWKHASRELARDPATILHLNFEGLDEDVRRLSNLAAFGHALGGEMYGCKWTEGRWSQKRALEFNGENDKVRFVIPGLYQSLTYMAWIRVESLPNSFNALALSERRIPGAMHWQINRNGGIEFSVQTSGLMPDGGQSRWDRLFTQPVIETDAFGRWVHVAAVYDGPRGTMSVYVNGQLVRWKSARAVPLIIGDVGLGNWHPLDLSQHWHQLGRAHPDYQWYIVRNFRGRMDEFTILSRPLSAEEIRFQYEVGKPNSSTHPGLVRGEEGSFPTQLRETEFPEDVPAG